MVTMVAGDERMTPSFRTKYIQQICANEFSKQGKKAFC